MYNEANVIFFKALTGIHAGSGAELGMVDLPIQREKHTGFPKVEGSGIKGCIRDAFERLKEKATPSDFIEVIFGPDNDGDKHSGSVAFTDARILLFPLRSAKGVFAYATCPFVINRLIEDFKLAGIAVGMEITDNLKELKGKALCSGGALHLPKGKVVLEEYTYEAQQNHPAAKALAKLIAGWLQLKDYQEGLVLNNLIILPDDDFTDFVQNSTEIITRIRIDSKTGTVTKGGLFTEELLPTESVLYSLTMASSIFLPLSLREDNEEKGWKKSDTFKEAEAAGNEAHYILNALKDHMPQYIQIGGDATIGKGLVNVTMVKGVADK